MPHRSHLLIGALVLTVFLSSCASQPALHEMEEWDLVWISDSSGWDVARVYAAMVEQDTGIRVNVHDNWMGGLSAGDVLHALQGTPTPSLTLSRNAEQIREAELIVIYGNPEASINASRPGDWSCVGPPYHGNDCDPEIFETYVSDLEQIYAAIFELRGGRPTIVRTFDAYNPLVSDWKDAGAYEACKQCWTNYNAAIHEAAAAYNVPVARVFDAWNGPNFETDPQAAGFTKDGEHPNETGGRLIAEALRALGYEPVVLDR